jgi:hypothetical protein
MLIFLLIILKNRICIFCGKDELAEIDRCEPLKGSRIVSELIRQATPLTKNRPRARTLGICVQGDSSRSPIKSCANIL